MNRVALTILGDVWVRMGRKPNFPQPEPQRHAPLVKLKSSVVPTVSKRGSGIHEGDEVKKLTGFLRSPLHNKVWRMVGTAADRWRLGIPKPKGYPAGASLNGPCRFADQSCAAGYNTGIIPIIRIYIGETISELLLVMSLGLGNSELLLRAKKETRQGKRVIRRARSPSSCN